jgi:hypothetical protein
MTHDHLLAEINDAILYQGEKQVWKALRAVVELHKPDILQRLCSFCSESYIQEYCCSRAVTYPCPTIQAIEKELK